MEARTVVLGVLSGAIAVAISQAHANPMNDLCTILNTGRNNLAALNRQIANESNPLKKDSLQQRFRQINQQTNVSLDGFFKDQRLRLVNFAGTVSSLSAEHYNTGPGVMLRIALPCKVNIAVQFVEITNPGWGNLNPDNQTPLPPFRPVLENLAVHDTVTFSGRLPNNEFSRHFTNSSNGLSFFAVLTELGKKGGIASKAPDPYLPPTTATFSKPAVTQGGLTWMPPTFSRNWAGANAYCQGMSGWRLPTEIEVQKLVRSGAINGQGWFSPGYGQAAWTSTSAGPVIHMTVLFQTGDVNTIKDEHEQSVTCVRAAG